ncbi:hypothetical protein [Microbacterium sp. NPDC056052]|uniref:hypothetical protein n=1 Tax=Microbacterium sp. NPDC056052 TaxID=3345695 RepID=UPI0035DACF1B
MKFSDWISLIALVVSLATAGWTAYNRLRWAKPVPRVSGTQWMSIVAPSQHSTTAGFSIDITNVGDHATQITKAYWEIDRGNGIELRLVAGSVAGTDSLFEARKDPSLRPAPGFPFTLERYQSRGWDYIVSMDGWKDLQNIRRARVVVEYTSRKSHEIIRGPWEPSQIALEARRSLEPSPDE